MPLKYFHRSSTFAVTIIITYTQSDTINFLFSLNPKIVTNGHDFDTFIFKPFYNYDRCKSVSEMCLRCRNLKRVKILNLNLIIIVCYMKFLKCSKKKPKPKPKQIGGHKCYNSIQYVGFAGLFLCVTFPLAPIIALKDKTPTERWQQYAVLTKSYKDEKWCDSFLFLL